MTLEEKLRSLRLENHYSQRIAAEKLNISETDLSDWETGFSSPTLSDLNKLRRLYHVPLEYLLDHEISQQQKERMQNEKSRRWKFFRTLGRKKRA